MPHAKLGLSFVISRALPEDEYPDEVAGGPIVIVAFTHTGTQADAVAALAPLAAAAAPVVDDLGEKQYLEIQRRYDEAYGWGQRYYAFGAFANDLRPTTIQVARRPRVPMRSATQGSRPPGRGGAIADVPDTATASRPRREPSPIAERLGWIRGR